MNAICIKCWDPDATVTMDLDGSCLFRCRDCDEEFEPSEVRDCLQAMQGKWARLLKWADAYPQEETADAK